MEKGHGISIVTCTNKTHFMKNIFENYYQQKWSIKELIIILNSEELNTEEWEEYAKQFSNVSIYRLPSSVSLGHCLNYAIDQAKYQYIAKFDDDDYYGPLYVKEGMEALKRTKADIVGKRAAFIYVATEQLLMVRFPKSENRFIRLIHGATIMASKEVFKLVPFPNKSLGEDQAFLKKCRLKKLKIYSTSIFNFTIVRRNDELHTWKAKKSYLEKTSKKIAHTTNYKEYANGNVSID